MSEPYLLIDSGNTRLKWRHHSSAGEVSDGQSTSVESALEAFESLPTQTRVWVAHVGSPAVLDTLTRFCQVHFEHPIRIAQSAARLGDLINGYAEPARLGVDRWLNLVCARQTALAPYLIVSAGTAFTLDALLRSGVHLGGWILPGLRSLSATQSIDALTPIYERVIHQAYAHLQSQSADPVKILLTGGDAPHWHAHWIQPPPAAPTVIADSVLRGLYTLAQHARQ
jgi:pantothenate kinase type III